ncbi:MAG: CHAT domain-containing tetratricopeptide repeat protein [Bacteroidia bacterium]
MKKPFALIYVLLVAVAESLFAQTSGDSLRAENWFDTAQTLSNQAQYDSAIVYFRKSANLFRRQNLTEGYVRAINHIGIIHIFNARVAEGKTIIDTVLSLSSENPGLLSQRALGFIYLGSYYQRLSRPDSTAICNQIALTLQKQIDDLPPFDLIMTYNNIGSNYNTWGAYEKAITYLDTAIHLAETRLTDNLPVLGILYNNLGFSYAALGEYERSVAYLEKGKRTETEALGENHPNLGITFVNLAKSIQETGDFAQALAYYQKGLKIFTTAFHPRHPYVASAYTNIGQLYGEMDDFTSAIAFQRKAIHLKKQILSPDHYSLAASYGHLAGAFSGQQKPDSALYYYQRALGILEPLYRGKHNELAVIYRKMGLIYRQSGKGREAEKAFRMGISALCENPEAYFSDNNDSDCRIHPELIYLFGELGSYYSHQYQNTPEDTGILVRSLEAYSQAVAAAEALRAGYHNRQSKENLTARSAEIFREGAAVAFILYENTGDPKYLEKSFWFSEKTKATLLLEAEREAAVRTFAGIPETLIQEEYLHQTDRVFFEKQLFAEQKKGNAASAEAINKWKDSLFSVNQHLTRWQDKIKRDHPGYFRLKYGLSPLSTQQIASDHLGADEAIISYTADSGQVFIFLITRKETLVKKVLLEVPLPLWVDSLYAGLCGYHLSHAPTDSLYQALNYQYTDIAFKLYQKLLAPLEGNLPGRLIIVPDGILGYIPFEALLTELPEKTGAFRNYPFLVKKYAVSYIYSASQFVESARRHRNPPKYFMGMAPEFPAKEYPALATTDLRSNDFSPLYYNQEEIEMIRSLIHSEKDTGFTSTLEQFILHSPNYRIIHLATHGKTDDQWPDYSFLAFQYGKNTDSITRLYIRDLYALKLQADMVVLSACETGTGRLLQGEGIISLARGFSYAGAASLITTLWRINDRKTATFMQDFYLHIFQGKTKDQALQQAKNDYLENNDDFYAHPYFWASYQAIGDMQPVPAPGNKRNIIWIIFLITAILVGGMYFWLKRKQTK